ncbi:GGDEF domain-containing protein [Deinococcus depolymerans]|uniref:GGDEF domain-containing protein n=1 Tax=Deinococcus depolymerans TaxID=392408 RepID=A0ABN1BPN8_9DEIO
MLEGLTRLEDLLGRGADQDRIQAVAAALAGQTLRADLILQSSPARRQLWAATDAGPPGPAAPDPPGGPSGSLRFAVPCCGGAEWEAVRLDPAQPWTADEQALAGTLGVLLRQLETRRQQRHTVEHLERQLQLALDTAPLLLWAADPAGTVQLAAGRGLTALHLRGTQLEGRSIHDLLSGVPRVPDLVRRAQQGETVSGLVQLGARTFESWYLPLPPPDHPGSVLGIGYDVTELLESRQAAETARRQAETLLRLSRVLDDHQTLSRAAQDVLALLVDHFGSGWAALWGHQTGWFRLIVSQGEVPLPLRNFQERGIPDSDRYGQALLSGQAVFLGGDQLPGAVRTLGLNAAAMMPVTLDAVTGPRILTVYRSDPPVWTEPERDLLFAAARTVQVAHRRLESLHRLQAEAATDSLTGLGNRRSFERALNTALHAGPCLLVSTDLDGLKRLNDSEGHPRGDALLRRFAQALRAAFPPQASVFRLGGDEFMVILPGTVRAHDALARVVDAAQQLRDAGFRGASASAGAASAPDEARTAEDLIRLSDTRMYAMKASRRSP